jgi:hypothetical protein
VALTGDDDLQICHRLVAVKAIPEAEDRRRLAHEQVGGQGVLQLDPEVGVDRPPIRLVVISNGGHER